MNSIVVNDVFGIQRDPDIVFGAGTHFVVWGDARAGNSWIFGARVTPDGTVLDPSGIAISLASGDAPAIEFDGSRFFVVWSSTSSIEGAFCSTGGAPEQYVTINATGTALYAPTIAFDGSNYLVAWVQWTGSGYEIRGQQVSQSGTLIGPYFTVGATSIAIKPGLCFDGNYYCFAWTESNDIWARQYTTSAIPVGPAFTVSHNPDAQLFCDVAAGASNYLFTWGQIVSGDYDVYGNVDIAIAVSETKQRDIPLNTLPTIVSGPLPEFMVHNYIIYDISGREIRTMNPVPGVYFIEINGELTKKIIKIK
ncbi:T9SS type A sorting domain-containing protein [candidate division WOR-3 bacterium]|nr:T9SS type A sorting domain-containing protein [candidate division WOR-3 bacterium]